MATGDWKPTGPERYGEGRYCIKTALSESGEIYAYADEMAVSPAGDLILSGAFYGDPKNPRDHKKTLIVARGEWTACYAASCIDGSPACVERWPGEIRDRAD